MTTARVLLFLKAHWRTIAEVFMILAITGLSYALAGALEGKGELKAKLKVANEMVEQRNDIIEQLAASKETQATREADSYSECIREAILSDSQAFKSGVEVGKVIGRKEAQIQCVCSK